MSSTPVSLSDELFVALGRELDEDQLVELTSVIAVESMRGRFNLALAAAPRVSARAWCARCRRSTRIDPRSPPPRRGSVRTAVPRGGAASRAVVGSGLMVLAVGGGRSGRGAGGVLDSVEVRSVP
jgi:hypothetical protein